MAPRVLLAGALASLLFDSCQAVAQQIAVQQPVVGVFQGRTTVSVPDRGTVFLGGVRSAASGRSSSDPLRSGSSFGFSREVSTASAQVFIHDFHAMDEALLAAAGSPRNSHLDPQIVHRWEQRSRSISAPADRVANDVDLAVQAERLAEQAEARGKFAVAKLHWQRAARHGSGFAVRHLADPAFAAVKPR